MAVLSVLTAEQEWWKMWSFRIAMIKEKKSISHTSSILALLR